MKRRKYYNKNSHQLFDPGRWCQFCYDLLLIVPALEAIVLSHLIGIARLEETEGRTRQEWFRCSFKKVAIKLNMTGYQQRRVLKDLEEMGYVGRKMRGNPAKRWMSIDTDKIEADVRSKMPLWSDE
jgi:ribosomal protein S19E (S16A)